jgi:hypothetical protein
MILRILNNLESTNCWHCNTRISVWSFSKFGEKIMSLADERNEKDRNVFSVKDHIGNCSHEHRITFMQIVMNKLRYSLVEIFLVGVVALILLYVIKNIAYNPG